jgi:hypothetical protein
MDSIESRSHASIWSTILDHNLTEIRRMGPLFVSLRRRFGTALNE